MIKDSRDELMEKEGDLIPQDKDNEWLRFVTGGAKPRPALEGRLLPKPGAHLISKRQQRGVRYGK